MAGHPPRTNFSHSMTRTPIILLAILFTTLSPMVSAKHAGDSPASVPVLLGLEPVRQDMKISSLQAAVLDSLRAEYKAKVGVIAAAGLADPKAVPHAEAVLLSLRMRYNQRAVNVLNPSQQQRLRQIERQMLRGGLLSAPSEQKLLGLSSDQCRKIAEIRSFERKRAAETMGRFRACKITSFHKDIDLHRNQTTASRSMLHLLTPDQTREWLVLQGPKLKL